MTAIQEAARPLAAAPGTLVGLHVALKARLQAVAARFPIMEKKTGARSPEVVDFTLPPKQDAEVENFPFICLRGRAGNDSPEGADQTAQATFDIEIGTYSDTDDGYLDLLAIVDAIRADLGDEPVIAGTAFVHVGPLTWDVPFPQPRPQWLGLVTTNWTLPRPQRVA